MRFARRPARTDGELLRRGVDAAFKRRARSFVPSAILQCCLETRPSGRLNLALRGHASIQGSTDIPTLLTFSRVSEHATERRTRPKKLQQIWRITPKKTGLLVNYPEYMVSTLKAYYVNVRSPQNDCRLRWASQTTGNHSFCEYLYGNARRKKNGGMFLMGQNHRRSAQFAAANEKHCRNGNAGRP